MEVIMKTTDENGNGLTNKSNASLGKKEEDKKTPGRGMGEVSNKKEDIEGSGKEGGLGKGSMAVDNKREGGEVGKETGGITGESKSIHVEDWENDPFGAKGENDVKAELNLRKDTNLGNSKGVENTGLGGEGRSMGSGPDSKKYNREDESGESGV
jgi:hypothetical protein